MTPTAFSYSAKDNVWFVEVFARTHFTDVRQVSETFASCRRYWKAHIGKRCYAVVDYTGTTIDKSIAPSFAEERQRIVSELTITTFRFTSDLEARAAIRAISIRIHQPSNLYASKEEALAVLQKIHAGVVTVGRDDSH
jgi:hypothetical protein